MDDFREELLRRLREIASCAPERLSEIVNECVTSDCIFHVGAPIEKLRGGKEICDGFFHPLRTALSGLYRRDLVFIGGPNRRDVGGQWCAAVTHYVGNFTRQFLGIPASSHMTFLRAGEFYRVENGRIAEARIILDIPDMLRQAGRFPFPFSYGSEITFPAPATQDGLLPGGGNGEATLDIVEGMLADLHAFDPKTMSSPGQTGAGGRWGEDMMWYGPAGIGSNYRWDGFVQDHRESFLRAFPDRKGGNHYCRIGDGDYAAVSGWPSMTMTWKGDYLGETADGRPLTLRVMDFYRCSGGRIRENWVMLDYTDLLQQMGVDLIARATKERDA
ncbi:MAG: hypothetical protein EX266_00830 [Rhodobacteraceae bacterium]|nr:MAG: hypothetical protein EX266_00830 [Paracoccaceae bacterium]